MRKVIFVLAFFSSYTAYSQVLTGRVLDESKAPMMNATVCLLSPKDSSFVRGTVADANGKFSIKSEPKGSLLKISMVGYNIKYINCQQQENIGDINMIPDSKLLSDVVVTGNSFVAKGDKMIIHIPDNIKKNTFDGYSTLSAMTIPGLNIDPVEHKVTSNFGDVLLCINGREVNADEIRTLNPQDISRIDYYQKFDPNHPAASSVIDFIMKNRDSGGLLYGNVNHNLNIGKGDGILDYKHYKKNSELNIQVLDNYGYYTLNRGEESTTKMAFIGKNIIKNSEVTNYASRSNRFNGKVSWLKQDKNSMLQIAASLNKSHDKDDQNMLQSYSSMNAAVITNDFTHKDILSPATQIYFQKKIMKDGLFRASIYGSYSHTDKYRKYTSLSSFSAKTEEDLYRLSPNILIGLNYGKNRPFFYADYDYKSTRNKYTENKVGSNNKLSYGSGSFQLGNNFIFSRNFRMTLQLTENVLSIDNGNKSWTKYYFSPSLFYNANLGHGNTIRGELYTYVNDPQMAYYNGSSQRMDQYQILKGNPELKNGHCIGIETVFDSNHKWGMLELFTQYINMPNYIYENVFLDTEQNMFVHTYQNGKSYNHFLLNTEIRLNIIPQKLIWKFGGEYDLFKDEGKKISEFVGGTDLTYIGKHFIGKVEFISPIRYLAKGVEYKNPSSLKLSLKYTLRNMQISFNTINPFMHSCVKTTYIADNYSNETRTYNPRITSNMFMLSLAYRISYGKKHNFQNIQMDDNQSSGLLDQQNIRNEKMERGKK
jgi:hypothetical protein